MKTSNATTRPETADDDAVIEVQGLKKYFEPTSGLVDRIMADAEPVRAVDGVDITVRDGEIVAVVGESGCGKTTLGQTILKLLEPTAGSIIYQGEDISELSENEIRPYRKELQMIFQDPLASLNPRKKVGETLTMPLKVHDIGDSKEERKDRVRDILERVGLKSSYINRYPHQFSGGQQQRIGIARALMLSPEFIVADEPTSALDVSVQAQVLNLLENLREDFGLSLLFITHDLSVVRYIADRVAVMYLGEIIEVAPTEELFQNPQHPYTKSLLSSVPRIEAADRQERILLEGSVPSPVNPPDGCRFHTRCPAIIPPSNWKGTQESFKAAFHFRNRVENGDVDPDDIRDRLAGKESRVSDEMVEQHVLSHSYLGDLDELPPEAASEIRQAAECLAANDTAQAVEILEDAFASPCEQTKPRQVSVSENHYAFCHRIDSDAEGQRLTSGKNESAGID